MFNLSVKIEPKFRRIEPLPERNCVAKILDSEYEQHLADVIHFVKIETQKTGIFDLQYQCHINNCEI